MWYNSKYLTRILSQSCNFFNLSGILLIIPQKPKFSALRLFPFRSTHVYVSKTLVMDVPTAIDGFKNIISSLNHENSLHFLNWVKENINGEFITKSDKTVFFRISNLHKKIHIHWFVRFKFTRHILITGRQEAVGYMIWKL